MAIVRWNKKYTETLAEMLKRFRKEKPEFENEKITYAGRLDPMAEGLVLLLTGIDVHKKDDFLNLDKVYEIDFVVGVETDTYDILGVPKELSLGEENYDTAVQNVLINFKGKKNQSYPPYSSRKVLGKPLFMWAREHKLHEIKIPTKEVEIYDIEYIDSQKIKYDVFKNDIILSIGNVIGDFRQLEIMNAWKNIFNKYRLEHVYVYRIRVSASSGTYMRSLVHELGKGINSSAATIKIRRISVGDFNVLDI